MRNVVKSALWHGRLFERKREPNSAILLNHHSTSHVHAEPIQTELRRIEENALYSAQAHFESATSSESRLRTLLVVCSIAAGLSGLIVALGGPSWIGAFAVICNAVTGVSAAFGVQAAAGRHEVAGKQWTQLRHDARSLRVIRSPRCSSSQLATEVEHIATRYNDLVNVLPPTNNSDFERARQRIQAGVFAPDFEADGDNQHGEVPTASAEDADNDSNNGQEK